MSDYNGWQVGFGDDEYESRQRFVDKLIEQKENRDIRDRHFKEGREFYYENEGKTFEKDFDGIKILMTERYTSIDLKLNYCGICCFGKTSLDRDLIYGRAQGICVDKEKFDGLHQNSSTLLNEIRECVKKYDSLTPYESIVLSDDLVFEKGRFDVKIDGFHKKCDEVGKEFLKECKEVFGDSVKWEDRVYYDNVRNAKEFLKLCELEARNRNYKKANVEIIKSGGHVKNAVKLEWNDKQRIAGLVLRGTDCGKPCFYTIFAKDGEYIMVGGEQTLKDKPFVNELSEVPKVLGVDLLWSGGNKIVPKDIMADLNNDKKKMMGKDDIVCFNVPVSYPRDNISNIYFRLQDNPDFWFLKKEKDKLSFRFMMGTDKQNQFCSCKVTMERKDDMFAGSFSDFTKLNKVDKGITDLKSPVLINDMVLMMGKVAGQLNSHDSLVFTINEDKKKFILPPLCSDIKFKEICNEIDNYLNPKKNMVHK